MTTTAVDNPPGLPTPRRYKVDQPLVARYAAVSGDHNPLHTDPDFAATTSFGRTIAHGMMTLAFVSDAMRAWAGSAWLGGSSLDFTFIAPALPGDLVSVIVADVMSGDDGLTWSIECRSGDRLIAVGTTSVRIEESARG